MLNACDIQLIIGKEFGDVNETLKTPDSPKHKITESMKGLRSLKRTS